MSNVTTKRYRTWTQAAVAGAYLMAASVAVAAPGDHIRFGATTFTPSLSTGLEGRTNAYLAVGEAITGDARDKVTPSLALYVAPAIQLETDTRQVRFKLGANYELRKYLAPSSASNLDRFNDFKVDAQLDVLRQAVLGFDVRANVTSRNQNSDNPFFSSALISQLRTDNAAHIHLRVGPDLQFSVGGALAWHNYRLPGVDNGRPFNQRTTYGGTFDVKWNFFPRTAAVLESSLLFNRWASNWVSTGEAFDGTSTGVTGPYGSFLALPDSNQVKVMGGLRGRFTKNLVLAAMIGYGYSDYLDASVTDEAGRSDGEADPEAVGFGKDVTGLDGLLVLLRSEIDLGYDKDRRLGQKITLQYRKDFQDSFFVNYVEQNHIQGFLNSRWASFVTTTLSAGIRFEKYRGEAPAERKDVFLRVDGRADFEVTPWMSITPRVFWTERASEVGDIEYDDVQAHLVFNFTY